MPGCRKVARPLPSFASIRVPPSNSGDLMELRTSRAVIAIRNLTRRLGLNRWVASWLGSREYEDRFGKALVAEVRPGDVVWDVGANVGHYTRIFAERSGPAGKVFAFEPSRVNYAKLCENTKGLQSVVAHSFGLGQRSGKYSFMQGKDDLGATSRVSEGHEGGGIEVEIRRGEEVVDARLASPPTFIKVDVEGFEWEVLDGLGKILSSPALHGLGIEVHFGILAERRMARVPTQIGALLKRAGFTCSWPDSSHVIAVRQK